MARHRQPPPPPPLPPARAVGAHRRSAGPGRPETRRQLARAAAPQTPRVRPADGPKEARVPRGPAPGPCGAGAGGPVAADGPQTRSRPPRRDPRLGQGRTSPRTGGTGMPARAAAARPAGTGAGESPAGGRRPGAPGARRCCGARDSSGCSGPNSESPTVGSPTHRAPRPWEAREGPSAPFKLPGQQAPAGRRSESGGAKAPAIRKAPGLGCTLVA